jgi:hypothetical protein
MGYGIITNNHKNITLGNIRCEFIRSKSDWAACIHGGEKTTTNLTINKFTIIDSDRAIELDAIVRNVMAQNGIILRVKDFNHTGNEAFTLDVHDHIGSGESANITYRNIYMKDSYAPTVKEASTNYRNHSGDYTPDLPRNVLYQNITVVNPASSWEINGIGITIKDSRVINGTNSVFVLYKNSRDILIKNIRTNIPTNKLFIRTNDTAIDTGIQNVSVIQNTITDKSNQSAPTISFENIISITLRDNTIANAPTGIPVIDIKGVSTLFGCNNYIIYANGTHEIWPSICNTRS